MDDKGDIADTPPSHQLKALMYKNATLQTRQRKTLCCQLFIPILLVSLVGIIQLEINKLVTDFTPNEPGTIKLFNASYVPFDGTGRFLYTWNCWYSTDNPALDDAVGYLGNNDQGEGLLGQITQYQVPGAKPFTEVTRPLFATFFNSSELMYDSLTALKEYDITQKVLGNKTNAGICPDCPVASFTFNNLTETPELVAINYTVLVDTQGNIFFNSNRTTANNMINTAFLRDVFENVYLPSLDPTDAAAINDTLPNIEMWDRPMPYVTQPYVTDVASFFAIFMLPMCFSFLLPVFLYGIVVEKQDKLRAMMLMMGLQMRWYWLVTCLYNLLLYTLIVLIVTVISLIFQLRIFTQTSPIFLFFSLLFWGLALVSMSVLVSSFFNSARTATIVGYLLVIASVIVANTLNLTTNYENTPSPVFLLYAPYAFYRIIFVFGLYCGVGQCPTPGFNDSQLGTCWAFLILDAVVYMIVGLYLDAVFPQQWGVRRHPLFPFYAAKNWLFPSKERDGENIALLGSKIVQMSDDVVEDVDDAVMTESSLVARAINGQLMKDDPNYERMTSAYSTGLLVDKIRKVYPSGKVAVETLSLAVPKAECFGLLGPNGAGKTTSISMLTGLFTPTEGRARVGGYDLETELYKVHRVMGVCPQFDILWENLSCLETILFYTRLKGVPSSEERRHADDALRSVGLSEFKDRMIEDLSGGMKRRVSLAVSLCGYARVVFLDEPTTGLDPVTRRQLWDVLLELKKLNRSLILTTHSMEEADVLCDRIGIMTMGELRCLGTAMQLKNIYGSGYTFTIQFEASKEENAKAFIEATFRSAQPRDTFPGHAVYTLNKDTFKISELFHIMASEAPKYGIVDWGLTQTTLEDVFLNVADEDVPPEDD